MNYNEFKKIFNDAIFEKSKVDLIRKIAEEPNRYIGLFRPTKPKAKILQNLLQSHEIRFGDAFETAIEKYLILGGYEILQKRYIDETGDALNVDKCFKKNENTYFVEQKRRDDHDSTKKRGQIDNFEKKLNVLISQYGENNMHGYFYFIDPDLTKNKNFYQSELAKMSNAYGVDLHLCYGSDFFDKISEQDMWTEIIQHLTLWKSELPDFPEINFDIDSVDSFNEIRDLSPTVFRKLFENNEIYNEILLTIFPEKKTLQLLLNDFKEKAKSKKIYETLSQTIENKINE